MYCAGSPLALFFNLVTWCLSHNAACPDHGKEDCPWRQPGDRVYALLPDFLPVSRSLASVHRLISIAFHRATARLGWGQLVPPSVPPSRIF